MQQAEALRDNKRSSPQALYDSPNSACREDTLASHRRAVERVITSARERLCEPISLQDMSRVAYLSTFHFNRVFHQITGLPPTKFISAMRLDEAKRLLLNTAPEHHRHLLRGGLQQSQHFHQAFHSTRRTRAA